MRQRTAGKGGQPGRSSPSQQLTGSRRPCPDSPGKRGRVGCYKMAMGKLSPIESEFDSTEDAAAYDRWFRAKVEASLADWRAPLSHDQVMAEADAIIAEAERRSGRG